ncbi:dialkylresorcinol condensing enzyme [Sulfurimonas sp. SAG-AH-194-C21]|nr:dialkylrecorsinol condensing enzyme [Sulfurimonas sp. SAG-AH-194-C21]MDF1883131.1 dialkylresorcinol condensing enzyme [Sulfurimonas sp. SAG-AH-194-C21]
MKKVLVLYYSQTGQLRRILESFTSTLADEEISVEYKIIQPKTPYPFPWPFYNFFDEFPEAVLLDGCEIEEVKNLDNDYDLIILGYTVWYMAPSIPITAFMQLAQAKTLFKDKPVVTVVACRDMWVLAQEKMTRMLTDVGARVIDHVALTDQGGSVKSLVSLPMWMLSGDKKYFKAFPTAGIKEEEIKACSRFGKRLNEKLKVDAELKDEAMLIGLGACVVNGKLIATEKIANRSFQIWSKLIKASGKKYSIGRKITITIYVTFLLALIFTVIPLNIMARKILNIFQKEKIKVMETLYELPSGR